MRRHFCRLFVAAALGVLLPACGHLIYDDWDLGDGFSMIDASSYTNWVYVNLETREVTTVSEYVEGNTDTPPAGWHFAMHRFDTKTNGAEVLETEYTSIAALMASANVPDGDFVRDEWTTDVVIYDTSQMVNEILFYAESYYNPEFSKWMDRDLSTMPPIYTPSNKVYILRFADGTMAAVRFTGYIGPKSVKGYNSFDYVYPLTFD